MDTIEEFGKENYELLTMISRCNHVIDCLEMINRENEEIYKIIDLQKKVRDYLVFELGNNILFSCKQVSDKIKLSKEKP